MAHAKPEQMKDLVQLLAHFRGVESLKEKSFGCFYLKSKGALHFHVQDDRRFAHVNDGKKWREVELPLARSMATQKRAIAAIQKILTTR